MVSRVEVRLDDEQRQQLEEIAEKRDVTISDAVRGLIEDAWEADMLDRRLEGVRRITSVEIAVPADPQDLCDELDARYA